MSGHRFDWMLEALTGQDYIRLDEDADRRLNDGDRRGAKNTQSQRKVTSGLFEDYRKKVLKQRFARLRDALVQYLNTS